MIDDLDQLEFLLARRDFDKRQIARCLKECASDEALAVWAEAFLNHHRAIGVEKALRWEIAKLDSKMRRSKASA